MNNWRLLLLAVVAVFQPIASFTDSNLIDGRQQCCDRLSTAPLQDTRSLLHGTYRLGKTTSTLRRLNERDETREDRRDELRQRVPIVSRPSSERPLVDIRGRVARQSPSEIARSSRAEFHLERPAVSQSRNRLLGVSQRKETARSTRDLQTQELQTRRVVERTSRDALERRNVRIYTESPRHSLFRNDYRTERFGNDRLSKNLFDSQREMQREQFRSVERRITLNRDARRVLSRTKYDVPSIEASNNMNNGQRIARERLSVVRRESIIRPDTRRTDERRDLQQNNEQRRSLTENTRLVDRIRDMHIRLNGREDNRENRQRHSSNKRLSTERFEESREQREDRSSRQQNKENIDRSAFRERRMQARRITQESRIINVMTTPNERHVDSRREIRNNERMSREIQDEIRENPDHKPSRERILMDRRNIRESRIMNTRNKRDIDGQREIRYNERMTRETRDENRENREEALSRERTQMDRRNIRESRIMNSQNTRDIADRRNIRHNERMTRETRDENRENREEPLSRERIQMDRRNIRESKIMISQNPRDVADRREIRHTERMTREIRDENRENREEPLSRERIQMDRRNNRESRIMNAQNKREVDDRREIRQNERLTSETREEIMDNLELRLSRQRIFDRRDTRNSRNTNTRNVRNKDDRREISHSERNTRDERENHINRHSVDRSQVVRNNIREFRVINNLITRDDDRRIDSKRETKFNNRMSRNENRVNPDQRLSLERNQMERSNIREFRIVNTPNDKDIDSRREIRYNERSTELRKDARLNPEHRISRQRIQMDRRNIREFRKMNIFVRTNGDTESRREMRTDERLHTENRENRAHRHSRERIQMDRRNNLESRIGNTLRVRYLDSRQDISYNERLTRETREELRENPDRRLARESSQVDRRNIRESRVNRVAARNERSVETDTENRREIRNNERLFGHILGDQITRERRVESRSADRVIAEDRDSAMMDRRARSADRRNIREIRAEPKLSRSSVSERRTEVFRSRVEHSHKIENREREAIEARSRNVEMARNRERISSVMVGKTETENDYTVANWQYVLYTLQAAYLCALFMQMLTPSRTEKAHKMSLRWLPISSHYNPIKVD